MTDRAGVLEAGEDSTLESGASAGSSPSMFLSKWWSPVNLGH